MDIKKIYLVEDDPSIVALLTTLLEMEGYQVKTPSINRSNFVGSIRKFQPEIIIMDVLLGKINGLEVLKKIRSLDGLKNSKVIMTSGTELGEECLQNGADSFILKPYMPDELILKIKELIRV